MDFLGDFVSQTYDKDSLFIHKIYVESLNAALSRIIVN